MSMTLGDSNIKNDDKQSLEPFVMYTMDEGTTEPLIDLTPSQDQRLHASCGRCYTGLSCPMNDSKSHLP